MLLTRTGRRAVVGLASLITIPILSIVDGTPALAATGCGSVCDGKNPQTYVWKSAGSYAWTCAMDAVTPSVSGKTFKKSTGSGGIYVELRYSPDCRTAWARTNAVYNHSICVYSYTSSGTQREQACADEGTSFTAMLNDAGYTAKACIYPISVDGGYCTDKY